MFTTGSKWFFGLGVVGFVLAAAYGWSTGGSGLGPLTAGYHGGVGDHFGYGLLVALATSAVFLGLVALATRDAAPSALAEVAGTDVAPELSAPSRGVYWPILGAFGVSLVVLGLVVSNVMFVIGLFLLLGVLVEWMVLAWSDRATGDPETNRLVRNRVMGPFEVPLLGFLIAGGTVLAFSRILLTSSALGAVWVATALGMAILAIGALIATKPRLSPNVVAGVLALCAVGVVAAGVASAARGERYIAPHETHGEYGDSGDDGGIHPHVAPGTRPAEDHDSHSTSEEAGH